MIEGIPFSKRIKGEAFRVKESRPDEAGLFGLELEFEVDDSAILPV